MKRGLTARDVTERKRTERHAMRRMPLGEILERLDLVTAQDVEAALREQQDTGQRIGEILEARGVVDDIGIARAMALRLGVDFVDLEQQPPDPVASSLLPEKFARARRVIPISVSDVDITVGMVNPLDVFTIDDIAEIAARKVRPVLVEVTQLAEAYTRLWGSGDRDEMMKIAAGPDDDLSAPTPDEEAIEIYDRPEDAPVIQLVNQLITEGIVNGASDIHLEPTRQRALRVRVRIDGVLTDVTTLPPNLRPKVVSRVKLMASMDIAERRVSQDGRISVMCEGRSVSIRAVTLPTPYGEAVVLRILEETTGLLELQELGFAPEALARYESIFRRPWGAVLVTGPTGCGKSTTLYATLAQINDPGRNIVTVEDPIEFHLDGIKQVLLNARAGMKFATALRAILRADPDVVLVGEIRDLETARIAIEAALTGHLMLSSLHTNTAAAAPTRLVEMGIEPFLVTSTLAGVVAQRLARRLCTRCRLEQHPSDAELIEYFGDEAEEYAGATLFAPHGCTRCSQTGYRGRIAIQEVLIMDEAINDLVLRRASSEDLERAAIAGGMRTMRQDGLDKAAAGITSLQEVFRAIG